MATARKQPVLLELPRSAAWRFQTEDGDVLIMAPRGAAGLSNERAGWLLDKAKQALITGSSQ